MKKSSIIVEKNILRLYREVKGGNCTDLMIFGSRTLSLLRKARISLEFYHITQTEDSEGPINWDKELYDVWYKTNDETIRCLQDFKELAKNDLIKG